MASVEDDVMDFGDDDDSVSSRSLFPIQNQNQAGRLCPHVCLAISCPYYRRSRLKYTHCRVGSYPPPPPLFLPNLATS